MPIDPIEAASRKVSGISASTFPAVSDTPMNGASTSIMIPWMVATVAEPSVRPSATDIRDMGATSTSLRKPNSRSQTIDTPDMNEPMSTDIAMMPGYMNWVKLMPPDMTPMLPWSPLPNMNRKNTGKSRALNIRALSCQNLSTSRYHIVYMPSKLFIILPSACASARFVLSAPIASRRPPVRGFPDLSA